MDDTLLVVIDAQRAFVDPSGSLARAFGVDEVRPGATALLRLRAYLAERRRETGPVFVRSEYRPAQFTGGRLDHPLADLCVPGRGIDCEWASGLDTSGARAIITKHEADVASAGAYRDVIEQATAEGARQVALAGFQFTTCVRASALSTVDLVAGRGVRVAVLGGLTAARASSYEATRDGVSQVEATRRELRERGVWVVDELEQAV